MLSHVRLICCLLMTACVDSYSFVSTASLNTGNSFVIHHLRWNFKKIDDGRNSCCSTEHRTYPKRAYSYSHLKSSRLNDWMTGVTSKLQSSRYRWLLKYADLRPYSDKNALGILFLLTNVFYEYVGQFIFISAKDNPDQWLYSGTLQVAGLVSSYYHWAQLHYGPDRDIVYKALLVDYVVASFTIMLFSFRLIQLYASTGVLPVISLALGSLAVISLLLSWKYEFQLPYIVFHGLWHVLSAFSVKQLFP